MSMHVIGEVGITDLDRFLMVFASEGHDMRWEHGCIGAEVFTPADEDGKVMVLLEFPDRESFEAFRDDPMSPPIMQKGSAQGPPTFRLLQRAASFEH